MRLVWIIMIVMMVLCIADAVTTAYGLSQGYKEGNPYAEYIMDRSVLLSYAIEAIFLVILGFGMNEIFKLKNKALTISIMTLLVIAMMPKISAVINNLVILYGCI